MHISLYQRSTTPSVHPTSMCYCIEPTNRTSTCCCHTDHMCNGDARRSLSTSNSSYWYVCMVTSLAEWELDAPGHLQCDYPSSRMSRCLQMENIGDYSDMFEAQFETGVSTASCLILRSMETRSSAASTLQDTIPGSPTRTNGPPLHFVIKTQVNVCNY